MLLDLNLPKLGGPRGAARDPRRPADAHGSRWSILTSSREDHDILEGYGLGANSYVVKPVDQHQLTEAITASASTASSSRHRLDLEEAAASRSRRRAPRTTAGGASGAAAGPRWGMGAAAE